MGTLAKSVKWMHSKAMQLYLDDKLLLKGPLAS